MAAERSAPVISFTSNLHQGRQATRWSGRLASLLLRLSEEYGERHERGTRLSFRLTHQDLARMIGSTRETVTTILNRFRHDGLIAIEHRIVIILDPERLRAMADGGTMSGVPVRPASPRPA